MIKDAFNYSGNELYELMDKQGKERFGSECKHKQVKGSRCLSCLRRVVTRKEWHRPPEY